MGENTDIGWTDSTRNCWMGCSEVFEVDPITRCKHVELGVCRFCYLKRSEGRFLKFGYIKYLPWPNIERDLLKWSPRKVFIENYGDYLHEGVPDLTVNKLIDLLESVDAHHMKKYGKVHQWQLLTKRAARLERFWKRRIETTGRPIPENFWLGVSIGNKASTYYMNHLKAVAAASKSDFIPWVSFEPLVQDVQDYDGSYRRGIADNSGDPVWQRYAGLYRDDGRLDVSWLGWSVIGGESDGKTPRLMDPKWAQDLVDLCKQSTVPVFFKQMGGVGRDNAGGDVLNGQRHQEFPKHTLMVQA